ncbi:MAG: Uncharacterised protein [Cellulomonadaceae bacterium TMED98]|nr:MAG: Uncharacterised protein [Cellulomonadaceae bacterium TMED98]
MEQHGGDKSQNEGSHGETSNPTFSGSTERQANQGCEHDVGKRRHQSPHHKGLDKHIAALTDGGTEIENVFTKSKTRRRPRCVHHAVDGAVEALAAKPKHHPHSESFAKLLHQGRLNRCTEEGFDPVWASRERRLTPHPLIDSKRNDDRHSRAKQKGKSRRSERFWFKPVDPANTGNHNAQWHKRHQS